MSVRILHLITDLSVGGAQVCLKRLLTTEAIAPWSHAVLSMRDEGVIGPSIRSAGVPVHFLGLQPGTLPLRELPRIARTISGLQPQILHCWMYHANLAGLLATVFASPRPRVLWAIHGGSTA